MASFTRRSVVNRFILLALVLGVISVSCQAEKASNVRLVEAMGDAINARNLDALDELVSQNVVRHSAATPGVVVSNLAEFKEYLRSDFATVPDSVQVVDVIFGSDDYVAMRARYTGTQTGPMGPFPASGKKIELPYIGILRIADGKVAEIWVEWDNLSALTQLGYYPAPDGSNL
jgi:steroid delta-isomerase-like uncharacterized protein